MRFSYYHPFFRLLVLIIDNVPSGVKAILALHHMMALSVYHIIIILTEFRTNKKGTLSQAPFCF
ncbi:hypothetical protein SN16_00940 [Salinicoccus roseus]|uniref:Uncharacterized protein n=1 Tax=Salinicoccus roseus TaxID=45670 RepID=A0A0C2E9L7_9STAP|nr:hypothetical protein SN16_00940 [Salinicoccus roseus]